LENPLTTDHRTETERLLREAAETYRAGREQQGKRGQQLAFGDFHADDATRTASLLTAMAHVHALVAADLAAQTTAYIDAVMAPLPTSASGARTSAVPAPVWLAARASIPLNYYTTRAAAQEHCNTDADNEGLDGELAWASDEYEPEQRMELDITTDTGTAPTGYTVIAITPATAYDPEEEQ
jgi:hypothetical protein